MLNKSMWLILTLAIIPALLLSACAGDGDDDLVIGQLNSVTGSLAEFGPPLGNGVKLAVEHINAGGGVNGGVFRVEERDTAVNPVQGVDAARSLVDVDNAVAILGALSSGVTIAVANSVAIPRNTLQVSGASSAPAITTLEDNDFLFRTAPSDAIQGVVAAQLAMEQGFNRIGIMYVNNAYGEGLADQFEETFTSLGGTITARVPHEDVQPTYTSELERATEGDPDALLVLSYPGQTGVYIREALEGDYIDTFQFSDAANATGWIEDIDGWDALAGSMGTVPGSEDTPNKEIFKQAYLDFHGEELDFPYVAEHYDAAIVIALAAAQAGTNTDSVAIRDALRSVANAPGEVVGPGPEGIARALELIEDGVEINYNGASGDLEFDENGDVTGQIQIWEIQGRDIEVVDYRTP